MKKKKLKKIRETSFKRNEVIEMDEIKHYNLKKNYHQCEKIIIIIHYYNFGINIFNKKN